MAWTVELHPIFDTEFENFSEEVQDSVFAEIELLERFGPALKRPHADTLNNSKHKNMKELRFKADDGVWRIAYAFDPELRSCTIRIYRPRAKRADGKCPFRRREAPPKRAY